MSQNRWFWDANLGVRNIFQFSFSIADWLWIEYVEYMPIDPNANILTIKMYLPSVFQNVRFDFFFLHVSRGIATALYVLNENNILNIPFG